MAIQSNAQKINININAAVDKSARGELETGFNLLSHARLSKTQIQRIKEILAKSSLKDEKAFLPIQDKVEIRSILNNLPGTSRAELERSAAAEKNGFKYVDAQINFLGKNFVDNTVIMKGLLSEYMNQRIIDTKWMEICCYSDVEKLKSDFNFNTNGFEYLALEGGLLESVKHFAINPSDTDRRSCLLRCATAFISSWGKANHIPFDVAAPLNLVCRDQDTSKNQQPPIFFAHVDFQKSDLLRTFQVLEGGWRPHLEPVLGPMSTEEYLNLKVVQIVNLWILVNAPTQNTLAVMDISSIDISNALRPFQSESGAPTPFSSMSLCSEPGQKWVALQGGLPLGHGIVFNSFFTPHTAVTLPKVPGLEYNLLRQSVEIRVAFFQTTQSQPTDIK